MCKALITKKLSAVCRPSNKSLGRRRRRCCSSGTYSRRVVVFWLHVANKCFAFYYECKFVQRINELKLQMKIAFSSCFPITSINNELKGTYNVYNAKVPLQNYFFNYVLFINYYAVQHRKGRFRQNIYIQLLSALKWSFMN